MGIADCVVGVLGVLGGKVKIGGRGCTCIYTCMTCTCACAIVCIYMLCMCKRCAGARAHHIHRRTHEQVQPGRGFELALVPPRTGQSRRLGGVRGVRGGAAPATEVLFDFGVLKRDFSYSLGPCQQDSRETVQEFSSRHCPAQSMSTGGHGGAHERAQRAKRFSQVSAPETQGNLDSRADLICGPGRLYCRGSRGGRLPERFKITTQHVPIHKITEPAALTRSIAVHTQTFILGLDLICQPNLTSAAPLHMREIHLYKRVSDARRSQ